MKILHEAASDGVSKLLKAKINAMDEASYAQYLRHRFYTCERPEHLGASNHLQFVAEKREAHNERKKQLLSKSTPFESN